MTAPRFQKGDNVFIPTSGKVGTINRVIDQGGHVGYQVTVDGKTSAVREKYLEPYIDEENRVLEDLALGLHGDTEEYKVYQTSFRLRKPLEGNFYSYLASRTLFNPYQFKPLVKFLAPGSEERLYIADEVGVGKTIEAGIILTELRARGRLDSKTPVLVVCPNVLGPKWVMEMQDRFNITFEIHDGSSLRSMFHSAQAEGRIPDKWTYSLVGLQLLRTERNMDMLRSIAASRQASLWSMVVVDEAHHMRNSGTESNFLGGILSGLTEMMLMLSATPLNLRDRDLFNQMHILNPALFPDEQTFGALLSPVKTINRCRRLLVTAEVAGLANELRELEHGPLEEAFAAHTGLQSLIKRAQSPVPFSNEEKARYDRILSTLSPLDSTFTRTLKREALPHRVTREPVKVPVELSAPEKHFHDTVIAVTEEAYLTRGGDQRSLGFITNMPRRMASSCIPAMREYLTWCLENDRVNTFDPLDDELEDDADTGYEPLTDELRRKYQLLIIEAERLEGIDTKYQQLKLLLKRTLPSLPKPQVVIFSFFVRTLRYLKRKLEAEGYRVGLICGDVPLVSDGVSMGRYEIIESFRQRELDILLSSEVGGEGLDFQFCQAIINYDLPYNPMRVEQRIGRIDRFGQTADKVVVASMYIKDTVDEVIYERLYERIRLVEDSVGGLEPILGNQLADLQREIIAGHLSDEQVEQRLREVELAVEQAKMEMRRFEDSRRELLGEDTFLSMFSNLENGPDFVKPSDAARLSQYCLNRWDGCRYEQLDENRGRVSLSPEVRQKLELYTRKPGSEGSRGEFGGLLEAGTRLVIFNGSLTYDFPDHLFLPPCGHWTKFLLAELQVDDVPRVFAIMADSATCGLPPGSYLVPLFEVSVTGFRQEIHLAAVPIDERSGTVYPVEYLTFARKVDMAAVGSGVQDLEPLSEPERLIDSGRQAIEAYMEGRLNDLRLENSYRIEARIRSLQKGAEVRKERLKRMLDDHILNAAKAGKPESPEFIRMTEAQVENERAICDHRVASIQSRKDISLDMTLIAAIRTVVEGLDGGIGR